MRERVISFLKTHPFSVILFWKVAWLILYIWGIFVPIQKKTMIFCSFGGRKFDDSPKALYDEICKRKEYKDWKLIWAFVEPEKFDIPRGKKVKVDTLSFFYALLYSRVWISNSGMDRGIELHRRKNIIVETWHGTPLKKIGGDENQNSLGGGMIIPRGKPDKRTIRCAQSEFDKKIFSRIFNAAEEAILLSDLPRNDALLKYTRQDIMNIRHKLGIQEKKKVILYTPTYREYLVDKNKCTFLAPPMSLDKWKDKLGQEYVLLIRAHYAVVKDLDIHENNFIKDVSKYDSLNDLYAIADLMISDYSSTYFDYSILDRPMLCFAYDYEEYKEKRGLYLDLATTLPCEINFTEDEVIQSILTLDEEAAISKAKKFHKRFAPNAGTATIKVIEAIEAQLSGVT